MTKPGVDHFTADFPVSDWRTQISHGKEIGLGEDSYELVTI